MSAYSVQPAIRPVVAPRRHLRAVPTPTRRSSAQTVQSATSNVEVRALARKAVGGILIVWITSLIIGSLCDTSIYQISQLKQESASISTQTQVLQQEVDSLRSPQNLATSARNLGMIVNSNPVFLKVATAKVLGNAAPASLNTSTSVSTNLIANSVLIAKSNPTKGSSTKMNLPALTKTPTASVKTGIHLVTKVVLPSAVIPASPTH
jgi:hypothetical protein